MVDKEEKENTHREREREYSSKPVPGIPNGPELFGVCFMQQLPEKYPQPFKMQTEVLGPMVCSTVSLVGIGVETSTSDRLS